MSLAILNKKKIFQGSFMSMWSTEFLDKKGQKKEWEWISKGDGVAVFPITEDNKVVLIKCFRIPTEKYNIELPAGFIDSGEEAEIAGRRELLEETGFSADEMISLPDYVSWAGASNMSMRFFIATGCRKIREPETEDSEDIEVLLVDADKFYSFYEQNATETPLHPGILAAYYIAREKGLVKN